MVNNILSILSKNNISILKMSDDLKMNYATAHALVNRKDLSSTKLGTLVNVAEYLDVDIKELYEN